MRGIRNAGTLASRLQLGILFGGDVLQLVVLVGARLVELGLRHGGEAVLEEPARERRAQVLVPRDAALGVGTHDERLVVLDVDQLVALVVVQRLVDLDVLAAGQAHDAPGLVAVQCDLAVLLLQRRGTIRFATK